MHDRPVSLERRYLLGATSDDENATVEVAYFKDADALNGIADEEDALIDAYLAGELGAVRAALSRLACPSAARGRGQAAAASAVRDCRRIINDCSRSEA